ncbi:hypothetical protein [Microbispora sp. NPDC049125]|uniref:hypothetical protein n=1 Tax=Microbispora sp. NPDC049125 TaxID=3154929 RepID=UPI003466ECBF
MSGSFTQEERETKLGGLGGKKTRQRSGAVAAVIAGPTAPAPPMPPLPEPAAPQSHEPRGDEPPGGQTEAPAKAVAAPAPPALPLPDLPSLEVEPELPGDVDLPQQINVYILPEAARRARTLCKEQGLEHADVAMQAIDAALREDVLGLLVQARRTDRQPAGSAFPARRRARPKARRGVRRVVWPCQFTDGQIAVLEELIIETGAAGGYSELISVAIEAHLLD